MSYFVTGATGFIGRHLVQELVDHREGEIFVLVRPGSLARMETLIRRWGSNRVTPVIGDLSEPAFGVDDAWITEHREAIDHFFHLAAIYDMTADDQTNELLNVGGTRHAVELADRLQVGCFHQVSSVAAAGEYHGRFDETMFDEGQHLPLPTTGPSSSPRRSSGPSRRCRGASTVRRSWWATARRGRWTRSTVPTTSSR